MADGRPYALQLRIGGFILAGSQSEQLLLRALAAPVGVDSRVLDPVLELHDRQGSAIYANDNWRSTQEAAIEATGLAPKSDTDAAILITLAPGAYTAIVTGVNRTDGIGLVEVYDLGQP